MHNSYPQLGYYHKGLGTYIYHDNNGPQMGNALTDLWHSITGGAQTAAQKAEQQLKDQASGLISTAKNDIISNFLDTGTGQAVVADAKQTWISQQADKVKTIYLQNKTAINSTLLIGGGLVFVYVLMKARDSGKRSVQYMAPPTPVPFQGAVPVVANPRRKRRKARKSRRKYRRS